MFTLFGWYACYGELELIKIYCIDCVGRLDWGYG
jgi:hypothetical protein